jgi:Kelch motif
VRATAVLTALVVALIALCVWPAPMVAQTPAWQYGPEPTFQYQRHDAVFVPGPEGEPWANKVYFLGGRTGAPTELPDIWVFDPVAGTYNDTGADVYEDVSNYNGNLILDDGTGRGPAIYVVGGTDKDHAGTNIALVQRYYPQTNEAEFLSTADNWPGKVAGYSVGGMGTAVLDDIIYVFGGWENITPPYFSSETWTFDPNQPSGYRWTNLNVALSVGRTYIQSAVQSGLIYSMGGISGYVGGDLVPTDVVEVLDPAAWWNGWTVLAPLPVPTAEGRGFGLQYDTLSANAPLDGKIYIAGGGDWPDISAEVMEYDVASNTWNQGFPDLNIPRVNLAGTFIPLCTDNPDDGLPGIWVFGGRSYNGCDPPYGPAEYYPLQCEEATMHVGGIDGYFSYDPYGRSLLRIHVLIEDGAGAPLGDVQVDGSIWAPSSGPYYRSRMTKSSGYARFHWGTSAAGDWQICIEDLARSGYTYVPDDNVVTCQNWQN